MRVGWKVTTLGLNVASVRYRALIPMLALSRQGVQSRVFRSADEGNLDGLDAVVFVKSFTAEDLFLAQRAKARGIPVVLDLCDNVFVPGYGGLIIGVPQVFLAMGALAQTIVVTTQPLEREVRERLPNVRIAVIPDGIESPALVPYGTSAFEDALAAERTAGRKTFGRRWSNVRARMREEGVGVVPRIGLQLFRRTVAAARARGPARLRSAALGAVRRLRTGIASRLRPPVESASAATGAVPEAGTVRGTTKRLLWFGNHGAPYARFGMLDLLEMREALEALAREMDVELIVVSDNRAKYEEAIRPLAIRSQYVQWSQRAVDHWMALADVVLLPNSGDAFSVCKSANRTVLALSRGVPVVGTATPALEPLLPFIETGDALQGLRRYLSDPASGAADAAAGSAVARRVFGDVAIAGAWKAILTQLLPAMPAQGPEGPALLVVLHLLQDLDLALPIMVAARDAGIGVEALCSTELISRSPRVLRAMREAELDFSVLADDVAANPPDLPPQAKALLTISESTLHAHRFAHALSRLALRRGLFVATTQHGFDNVGLTYEDEVQPLHHVDFAAQRIYIWGDAGTLHPHLAPAVRARCVPAGRPRPLRGQKTDPSALFPVAEQVVGIFENLHWHRFDDAFREAFVQAVRDAASAFPRWLFVVKPHHAGRWWSSGQKRPLPPNVRVADPAEPAWERYTAAALLEGMTAVITTPSTVALDAALQRVPVAVAAAGMELGRYEHLRLLRTPADWTAFLQQAADPLQRQPLIEGGDRFVQQAVLPGDGALAIVADLRAVLAGGADGPAPPAVCAQRREGAGRRLVDEAEGR